MQIAQQAHTPSRLQAYPKDLMLRVLPQDADILCTHPMFGPVSGRRSWEGLNLMYERVRVPAGRPDRLARCEAFLDAFRRQGCRMVEMTCEEHDKLAARTQFITHTVGRTLSGMEVRVAQPGAGWCAACLCCSARPPRSRPARQSLPRYSRAHEPVRIPRASWVPQKRRTVRSAPTHALPAVHSETHNGRRAARVCRAQLRSTPINTRGYEALLELVKNTVGDSVDLYHGLFLYNQSAIEEVERLEMVRCLGCRVWAGEPPGSHGKRADAGLGAPRTRRRWTPSSGSCWASCTRWHASSSSPRQPSGPCSQRPLLRRA